MTPAIAVGSACDMSNHIIKSAGKTLLIATGPVKLIKAGTWPSNSAWRFTQEADNVLISTGTQDGNLVHKLVLLVCVLLKQLLDCYCLHTIQDGLEDLQHSRLSFLFNKATKVYGFS